MPSPIPQGPTVVEVAAADGLPTLRIVHERPGADGGVVLQRLDPVSARWLPLSRHDTADAALARLVATCAVSGSPVADVASGLLGPVAAVERLAAVLDGRGVHVDGVRWQLRDVDGTARWLPGWPAPALWEELERHELEWREPRGTSWQREVIARHGDVYVNVTVGDVREAFVVVGAFADPATGLAAARAAGLDLHRTGGCSCDAAPLAG